MAVVVALGGGLLGACSGDDDDAAVPFPHRWTPDGVTVLRDVTGAHLLRLSAAGCVLDDLYREAPGLDVALDGVRVDAVAEIPRALRAGAPVRRLT